MILIIDNYDSFVHNLARYIGQLGFERLVIRNDATTIKAIASLAPSHIILSPGPCTPDEAGICLTLINHFLARIPILGICLGHQAIAQALGATIIQAQRPMHGMSANIQHNGLTIFKNLENPLKVGRYHSLIVAKQHLPTTIEVTAWSKEQEIMAIQHHNYPIFGVQFHPESVLTDQGYTLLNNFLNFTSSSSKG